MAATNHNSKIINASMEGQQDQQEGFQKQGSQQQQGLQR